MRRFFPTTDVSEDVYEINVTGKRPENDKL